jgi:hypothetical protein
MSTRSIVARSVGTGFKGIYVHRDGYPPYQGALLWKMVREDFGGDMEAVLKAIVDTTGAWSLLTGDKDWDTYVRRHHVVSLAERKRFVPHLGLKMEEKEVEQVEWQGEGPAELMDAEWVYVLEGGKRPTLRVLTGKLEEVGSFDLGGVEPDWGAVECGQELERCPHIAEYHFPELEGGVSARLSTKKYLGRVPLGTEDAYAVTWGGQEWRMSGSWRRTEEKLEAWVENDKGKKVWLQIEGPGMPKMELLYPALGDGGREL